ncbi:MAG: hypothetical protein ABF321_07660 [Bacteroidia bacterium]
MKQNETIAPRSLKYITCLEMVQIVLERELRTEMDHDLFNHLGLASCFMDQYLDELTYEQQVNFRSYYTELYESLWECVSYEQFYESIKNFIANHALFIPSNALRVSEVYALIAYCKSLGIKEDLKNFGYEIISCAIAKHKAIKSTEIRSILVSEGEAVLQLLNVLLTNAYGENPTFSNTLNYLKHLEHILNLGDDTLDVKQDKIRGKLNKAVSWTHRIYLAKYLFVKIIKTIAQHPMKSAYYFPVLSFYYFNKTRLR